MGTEWYQVGILLHDGKGKNSRWVGTGHATAGSYVARFELIVQLLEKNAGDLITEDKMDFLWDSDGHALKAKWSPFTAHIPRDAARAESHLRMHSFLCLLCL